MLASNPDRFFNRTTTVGLGGCAWVGCGRGYEGLQVDAGPGMHVLILKSNFSCAHSVAWPSRLQPKLSWLAGCVSNMACPLIVPQSLDVRVEGQLQATVESRPGGTNIGL